MYSLGIIFFEMCHPPTSTAMERHKMLLDIRKTDIKLPDMQTRSPNQVNELPGVWVWEEGGPQVVKVTQPVM